MDSRVDATPNGAHLSVLVRACLLACLHVCMHAGAPLPVYVRACMYVCGLHVCMHACVWFACVFAYRRPGFNCVVKQLRFWLFKVDCEFKDCDLRVLRIGHTCVIYTLRSNNCELREKSQFAIFKLRN